MKHPHFLYGNHAVLAALANPMRKIKRVLVTTSTAPSLNLPLEGKRSGKAAGGSDIKSRLSIVDGKKLDAMLPPGSVHQGIAIECEPLAQPGLQDFLHQQPTTNNQQPLLLLDQVSDPHNVGAILRSAAAFDIGAVVVTDRNAPTESGVMAKAASGALELVPLITVGNLAQTIAILKKAGYWVYGLDGGAKQNIAETKFDAKTALIMGAEGRGLRRLTGELCDMLIKLPISPRMESLNVSNAAAVAMYELRRMIKNK
jgi:23S rRNA (guanosine2251-2'-O)-methyltransferase